MGCGSSKEHVPRDRRGRLIYPPRNGPRRDPTERGGDDLRASTVKYDSATVKNPTLHEVKVFTVDNTGRTRTHEEEDDEVSDIGDSQYDTGQSEKLRAPGARPVGRDSDRTGAGMDSCAIHPGEVAARADEINRRNDYDDDVRPEDLADELMLVAEPMYIAEDGRLTVGEKRAVNK